MQINNCNSEAFYFVDTDASTKFGFGASDSQSNGVSQEDIDAKSKALEDREAALAQKEKEQSDNEKALKDREDAVA